MSRSFQKLMAVGLVLALMLTAHTLWGRGGGGRGGGGGGRGGGGGGMRGGGGGGFGGGGARPSPNMSRGPSFSAPRPSPSRPSPSARPSTPNVSRPSAGARPSLPAGGSRPQVGGGGAGMQRPGHVQLPSGGAGNRPSAGGGNRPSTLPSNRPQIGGGDRPQIGGGDRPQVGTRPNLPGQSERPGIANRPGGGGAGDRPGVWDRPSTLPGLGAGVAAGAGIGAATRPGDRPGIGDNRPGTRPGQGGGGQQLRPGDRPAGGNRPNWNDRPVAGNLDDLRINNINNINNNFNNFRDNNLSDRHEDWHDWHNDWHHDDWNHGCWNDHHDSHWDYMWDHYPVASAFGLTAWGVNRMSYWWGYSPYYNPYYDTSAVAAPYVDYSQPMIYTEPVLASNLTTPADEGATPLPPGVTQQSVSTFDQARQAFLDGDYKKAQQLTEEALKEAPRDAAMHEFRALTLFAQGDYKNAAATLHSVLAVGPGWDWTTLISLYSSPEIYTEQLRKLETYVNSNPKQSDAHFVLAYHYITCGHNDAAAKQLKLVIEQMPKDTLAPQLYQMMTGEAPPNSKPVAPPPAAGSNVSIAQKDVQGNWTAQNAGGAKFALALTEDNKFTWTYQQGNKKESVQGVYGIDGNTLAMEPDGGGTMLAQITPPKDGKFHFQQIGAAGGDPGLDFKK